VAMSSATKYISREEQAKAEIGVTDISLRAAIVVTVLFLTTLLAVLAIDQFTGGWRSWQILAGKENLRQWLRDFETVLEDSSTTSQAIRPIVRSTLNGLGVTGMEKVYQGKDNWLFYEPDVRFVTSHGFSIPIDDTAISSRLRQTQSERHRDPVQAIVDFNTQLAARNIQLIVIPTPVKPTIHPEKLQVGLTAPIDNADFGRFKQTLESRGVLFFDMANALAAAARPGPQYLEQDTHWRPEAMEQSAKDLAEFVTSHVQLPQSLGMEFGRTELQLRAVGDLATMLHSNHEEVVTIHPIRQPNGQAWLPSAQSEILWLGDSFSNIYSAEPMGFGGAAGFAEQFSFFLSRPIDAIRRNDNGAFATRGMLADDLAQGRDRLAGKKLVIWQFAARELSQGDWQLIELKLNSRPASHFFIPPSGHMWTIAGTVAGQGTAPRPGNVAYRDHILAVHLTQITRDNRAGGEAIVYLRSMKNGELTPAAKLQIGERIRVNIRDWSEVSRQYEFINRSDLPDPALSSQPACWGELIP